MKNFNPTHPLFASLITALLVTACGKNLHVGTNTSALTNNKDPSSGAVTDKLNPVLPTYDELSDEDKALLASQKIISFPKKDLSTLKDSLPLVSTDKLKIPFFRKLGPIAARPAAGTVAGAPGTGITTDANPASFIQSGMVGFSGFGQLPPKEAVKSVMAMKLIFKGFNLWTPAGSGATASLTNQWLCTFGAVDSFLCSGDDPTKTGANGANDPLKDNRNTKFWSRATFAGNLFSQIQLPQKMPQTLADNSSLFTSATIQGQDAGTVEVNLLTAFNLGKKSQGDLYDWLIKNSTPYKATGFRQFRFVMGTNVYADSGIFLLQLELDTTKLPAGYSLADPATSGQQVPKGNPAGNGGVSADNSATGNSSPPAENNNNNNDGTNG